MGRNFYSVLEKNAKKYGPDPALISPSGSISYKEYVEQIDLLAKGLLSKGIVSGERICLLAQNAIESFLLLGACGRTGAILFPINWRLSPPEIQSVLDLAQPSMLVIDTANQPSAESLELSSIAHLVSFGGEPPEGWVSLVDFFVQGTLGNPPAGEDDPFVLLSTAAVEGLPRAATLSHGNLITANEQLIEGLGLEESDRHLAAMPLFHVTGLGLSLATLQAGGANVIQDRFDPGEAVQLMDEHSVSLLASFPPVLASLLEARDAVGSKWDSLRYVLGLDSPETIQLLLATSGAAFWTGYGQSETTGVVTLIDVRQKPGSVGKPLPAAKLDCFEETGQAVPLGEPGEIVVQGPLVFSGYWGDEDASLYASRHGWHHTGDMGKFDDEGYLYYLGRKPEKDLIKSGGENIYPAEVEYVIASLPQVRAVCVIGVPDDTWGESVKAIIELEPGEQLSEDQISAAVTSRIASYKKPKSIDFIESMPRTSAGEIDRERVKATFNQ